MKPALRFDFWNKTQVSAKSVSNNLKKRSSPTDRHSLTASAARKLIETGAVEAGMIPKVEACLDTIDRGVRKVHIIDGRLRHSLLLEIYTNKGVGTEIVKDSP